MLAKIKEKIDIEKIKKIDGIKEGKEIKKAKRLFKEKIDYMEDLKDKLLNKKEQQGFVKAKQICMNYFNNCNRDFDLEVLYKIKKNELNDLSENIYKKISKKNTVKAKRFILIPFYKEKIGDIYSHTLFNYISPFLNFVSFSGNELYKQEFGIDIIKNRMTTFNASGEILQESSKPIYYYSKYTGIMILDLEYGTYHLFPYGNLKKTYYNMSYKPFFISKNGLSKKEEKDIVKELIKSCSKDKDNSRDFIVDELLYFDKNKFKNKKEKLRAILKEFSDRRIIGNSYKSKKYNYYPDYKHNLAKWTIYINDDEVRAMTADGRRGGISFKIVLDILLNRSLFY